MIQGIERIRRSHHYAVIVCALVMSQFIISIKLCKVDSSLAVGGELLSGDSSTNAELIYKQDGPVFHLHWS